MSRIDNVDIAAGEMLVFPTEDVAFDAAVLGPDLAAELHDAQQRGAEVGLYKLTATGGPDERFVLTREVAPAGPPDFEVDHQDPEVSGADYSFPPGTLVRFVCFCGGSAVADCSCCLLWCHVDGVTQLVGFAAHELRALTARGTMAIGAVRNTRILDGGP